jgi:hypothetical protein
MSINLLARTQAYLRMIMRSGPVNIIDKEELMAVRNWQVGQPKPYQIGRLVVIPAYNDSFTSTSDSYIWFGKNGRYHVKSVYGLYHSFSSYRKAIDFALEM